MGIFLTSSNILLESSSVLIFFGDISTEFYYQLIRSYIYSLIDWLNAFFWLHLCLCRYCKPIFNGKINYNYYN